MFSWSASREVLKLLREVIKALTPKPPQLGFSIVRTNGKIEHGDYLHIRNFSGRTLHRVRLSIKKESHQLVVIQQVYRINDDAFGRRVRFKIHIPESGIYFRNDADFVIPLKEIGEFKADDKLELHFEYMNEEGAATKGNVVYPVRVDITDAL